MADELGLWARPFLSGHLSSL